MRVTFDANVLVYAVQAAGGVRSEASSALVGRAIVGDCVQTLQSLAECYSALVRKRHLKPGDARDAVTGLASTLRVEAATPDDLERAMWANAAHGIPFWDAMLWATARRVGCELLLSEDGHDGRSLEGVRWVNPFVERNQPLLEAAIPPFET